MAREAQEKPAGEKKASKEWDTQRFLVWAVILLSVFCVVNLLAYITLWIKFFSVQ